ncbi:MAG TPA: MarR family winged helix-turn-helix transcriptional regulator [Caulobacteraceae bacterium]|jgi:DNA-binding MarR family transcriptional regulator|nr:MarR family winged helix-turn-helix transcriptional regulator [Caulobacteraceae bacterium]
MTTASLRPPPDVSALAEGLRSPLLKLGRLLRREAQPLGLSPLDSALLGAISKREGVGVSELAELEQTSRPTMSAHVKRLEAAGWIKRLPPPQDDRRRFGLMITPAGRRAQDAVRRRRTDWLAVRLAALDPAAREALERAVGPLVQIAGGQP